MLVQGASDDTWLHAVVLGRVLVIGRLKLVRFMRKPLPTLVCCGLQACTTSVDNVHHMHKATSSSPGPSFVATA